MKNIRLFSLVLIQLSGLVSAGGSEFTANSAAKFENTAFCHKYGCQLRETRKRYGSDFQLYTLRNKPQIELEIYTKNHAKKAAQVSIVIGDDWSEYYNFIADFFQSVFPKSSVTGRLMKEVDTSTNKAALNATWNTKPLIIARTYAIVPTLPSVKLVMVTADTVLVGQ